MYLQLMISDHAFYRWITELEETGLFLITDAPTDESSFCEIANKVAHIRETRYG